MSLLLTATSPSVPITFLTRRLLWLPVSDAIEGADVMLYGVSFAYKESANCRLEANYAHQQELDMIPLMMQKDFKPKGWLGLILGTRMW